MNTLVQDVRYGIRLWLKNPAFTTILIITLSLGVGLNTTLFSLLYAILIKPLPYKNPEQLMMLWKSNPVFGLKRGEASLPEYLDWRAQSHAFEDMAAFRVQDFNLIGEGDPERVAGAVITASLFSTLKIAPVIGRALSEEDNRAGSDRVILLSYGLWNRRYGADPGVIGKTVWLDDKGYTVIGVMPPRLKLTTREVGVWLPITIDKASLNRGLQSLRVIARLKPSLRIGPAQADISLVAEHLAREYPRMNSNVEVSVVPLHEEVVGKLRLPLLFLFGATIFVLLIVCANVVNLLLAGTVVREKEMSIRTALGASRLRLVRQLLTESLLLALLGGGLGLLLSFWGLEFIKWISPTDLPRLDEVRVSSWAIGFTFLVSLLTGILCGLLSAQQVSRPGLNELLKAESQTATGSRRGHRLRHLLLVSEVALALVLSISAGLLLKSFERLWHTETGFNPAHLLTMELSLPASRYVEAPQQISFYRQALEKIAPLPDVRSTAVASSLPILGVEEYSFTIEGQTTAPDAEATTASRQAVSPNYFRTMEIPILRGRVFNDTDVSAGPAVMVINQAMAHRYWGEEDPVGKRIKLGSVDADVPWITIVGVVQDVRESGLDTEPNPEFYVPFFQDPIADGFLVVRTGPNSAGLLPAVQAAILSVDNNQPVANVRTMEEILSESVAQRRFVMSVIGLFAACALTLAALGIYGVVSYALSQRTREIGIRMALGARPRDVLRLVLGQSMVYVLAGLGLGLLTAFAATRLMSSLLYEMSATDPVTFIAVTLLLIGISLVASYIPSSRATKIAPSTALRHE